MISRRTFGKILLGGGTVFTGGFAALKSTLAQASRKLPWRSVAPTNQKWVMVIDLAKCDGCKLCTEACNAMHFTPPMQEWINVYEMDAKAAGSYFMPRLCMQCDNPPCVRACPVGATFKRTDGIVLMDQDRCIGCRNCIAQCPYSARYFNWAEPPHTAEELARPYSIELNYPHRKGVVEKCILCPSMLREGKLPACASACVMNAILFGDELEDAVTNAEGETFVLSELLKKRAGYRLLEELGTEPRVYYLPPVNREFSSPEEVRSDQQQSRETAHERH